MRRLLLAFVLLLGCRDGIACTCVTTAPFDPAAYLRGADVAFIGRIDHLRSIWPPLPDPHDTQAAIRAASIPWGPANGTLASFQIERALKGTADRAISLYTGHGGGDCGADLREGLTYLVFAKYDRYGALITNMCSGTTWLGFRDARERFAPILGDYHFADPEPYEARMPGIAAPVLIGPRVPELAMNNRFPVALVIDREGRVTSFRFVEGVTECTTCCEEKREALARWVPTWRFLPAMLDGQPVASVIRTLSRFDVRTTDEGAAFEKKWQDLQRQKFERTKPR
jgi:hypothetical protein